jgi:hypothetical protein
VQTSKSPSRRNPQLPRPKTKTPKPEPGCPPLFPRAGFLTFVHISTVVSNVSIRGQLLPILRLRPAAFESAHCVRMSTKCYNKMIDNHSVLLPPYPMFLSLSTPTNFEPSSNCPGILLLDLLSANSVPSVLKSNFPRRSVVAYGAEHSLTSLESALPQNVPVTRLESALPKTWHLKPFRIRTYEKRWGEGPLSPLAPTRPSHAQFACSIRSFSPARKARDA